MIFIIYIDSVEEVVSLFEVEVQKPRNLNVNESEECEHREGVGVYPTLLQSDTHKTRIGYNHLVVENQVWIRIFHDRNYNCNVLLSDKTRGK